MKRYQDGDWNRLEVGELGWRYRRDEVVGGRLKI